MTLLSNGQVQVGAYDYPDNRSVKSEVYVLTYQLPSSPCQQTYSLSFTVTVGTQASAVVGGTERFGPGSVNLTISNYNAAYTYTWYEDATSATLASGSSSGATFTTPSLTQSRDYYLAVTDCQQNARVPVHVLLRRVQLLIAGVVPTQPVALAYGTGLTLQANPANAGPYTWLLNGQPVAGETSAQLTVYTAGSYTVRLAGGTSPEDESAPVEVLDALAGQQVNQQPLTYTSTLTVLKPGVTDPTQLIKLGPTERQQTVTYANSLGQPIQQLTVQAGPAQEDIVQHLSYEGSPTAAQSFLPFSVPSATKTPGYYEPAASAKQTAYYAPKDSQPFSTTTTEASPLGRPLEQTQSGQAWTGHTTRLSYASNTATEVRHWQGFDGTQFYPEGQLTKEISLDPDNRRTEVFKDQLGRVVLQRKVVASGAGAGTYDTYTVYTDAGYVQLVIPPAAIQALTSSGQWNIQDAGFKDRWLYQYTYDDRGRVVERKFPGAAAVYLVYDSFDRPVLVQDGTHRASNQWLFTKFDAQNRAVVEGLWSDSRQRSDVQAAADQFAPSLDYETRSGGSYTTSNTFPVVQDGASGTLLALSFFDDYDLNADGQPDYTYRSAPELSTAEQPTATTQTRGLATVTRRRLVAPDGQYGDWLTTALFYDQYGNLIQKQGNNLLQPSASLLDVTTLVYREQGFVPQVLKTIKKQEYGGATPVVIRNRFTYDAVGHLLQTWQQNQTQGNLEPEVLVSSSTYTGLGELTQKRLHSTNAGATFLQTEDFAYNLHGQLSSINHSDLTTNPENDLFGLELVREQANATGNAPRYDGGISAVSWTAHNAAQQNQPERERRYRFGYDGLGRLTDATYAARSRPQDAYALETGAYDEKNMTYDANGNLLTVQRFTQASATAAVEQIDNLALNYGPTATQGNQLLSAYDNQQDPRGFGNGSSSAYAYDANGSVTQDGHKNASFQYNTLNKVSKQTVGGGTIAYTYDAAGTVVRKVTTTTTVKTEYFVDGFVYESSTAWNGFGLRSVPTPEGRAVALQLTPAHLVYEYHLRDHLGNLRVAFRARQDEVLHLAMEDPSREEGDYPLFQHVASSQGPAGISYHGPGQDAGAYAAAVSAGQPGPSTRIPMVQGDKLQVSLYYNTAVQAAPSPDPTPGPEPPLPTGLQTKPVWLLAPSLTTGPSFRGHEAGAGPSRPVVGVQLSVTGLLARLVGKAASPPLAPPASTSSLAFHPVMENVAAYVAVRVYNAQNQLLTQWQQPAPTGSLGWAKLRFEVQPDLSGVAEKAGYVEVQLLNDGSQPVYFDSVTIRQPQQGLLVTQEQHYYPFGLPLSGVAVNTLAQPQVSKEQFNGGSTVDDALLGSEGGVYSTFYRNYDPTTGRFQGVDPLAEKYADASPYAFSFNDPVNFSDPDGDDPIIMNGRVINQRSVVTGQETWSGSALEWQAFQMGGIGIPQGPGVNGNYVGTYIISTQVHEAQQRVGYDKNRNPIIEGTGEKWTTESIKWELRVDSNYIKSDVNYYGKDFGERVTNSEYWLDVVLDQLDFKGDPHIAYATVPDLGITGPAPELKVVKGAYSVYQGVRDGKIVYWGLTKNYAARVAQHVANGRAFALEEVFSGLSRSAARGLEQIKIDQYGLKNLDNIINGIGVKNPRMAEYYREAVRYLQNF
ncbi:DUF6443 domain-containing protein [Hymenobacter baengnokdamensis]|uniref:DUF6443 domain-containing protein n=1 Tax=Hymenobacter baengnokdamensis TaxID=2615203 RepID=UPI0017812ADB|nr:DUF6443 domain-containing protein [Hymenobacter baengnokdamensis]